MASFPARCWFINAFPLWEIQVAPCWRKLFDRLSLQCKQAPSGVILEQRDPGTTSPVSYITYAATVWRNWIELNRRCSAHCGSRESIDVFDIYTIIFLALAVFIFLRLRSVLGQRTGRERPPYDPYSARDAVRSPAGDNKVGPLPTNPPTAPVRPAPAASTEPPAPAGERWKDIAEADSAAAAGLDA